MYKAQKITLFFFVSKGMFKENPRQILYIHNFQIPLTLEKNEQLKMDKKIKVTKRSSHRPMFTSYIPDKVTYIGPK